MDLATARALYAQQVAPGVRVYNPRAAIMQAARAPQAAPVPTGKWSAAYAARGGPGAPQAKPQGIMGALAPLLNNPIVKTGLKPLMLLDTGRRGVQSSIREVVDALDSDPNTNASWGDLVRQTKDYNTGFGTLFNIDTGNKWLDRLIGGVGDVATDPLTYLTFGAGKFAGQAGRMALAADAAEKGLGEAVINRIGRMGVHGLDDAQRELLGAGRAGLRMGIPGVESASVRLPGTGKLAKGMGEMLAEARVGIGSSKAGGAVRRARTPEHLRPAYERLATGKGPISATQAAGHISASRALLGEGRAFQAEIAPEVEKLIDDVRRAGDGPEITRMLEAGDLSNPRVAEIADSLKGIREKLVAKGIDVGKFDNYAPHVFTQAFHDLKDIAPDVGKLVNVDDVATPGIALRRQIRPGSTLELNGRKLKFTSATVDDINEQFAKAFPELGGEKVVQEDAATWLKSYADMASAAVGNKAYFDRMKSLGLADDLTNKTSQVVDKEATAAAAKQAGKDAKGLDRQAADVQKQLDSELETLNKVGSEITGRVQASEKQLRSRLQARLRGLKATEQRLGLQNEKLIARTGISGGTPEETLKALTEARDRIAQRLTELEPQVGTEAIRRRMAEFDAELASITDEISRARAAAQQADAELGPLVQRSHEIVGEIDAAKAATQPLSDGDVTKLISQRGVAKPKASAAASARSTSEEGFAASRARRTANDAQTLVASIDEAMGGIDPSVLPEGVADEVARTRGAVVRYADREKWGLSRNVDVPPEAVTQANEAGGLTQAVGPIEGANVAPDKVFLGEGAASEINITASPSMASAYTHGANQAMQEARLWSDFAVRYGRAVAGGAEPGDELAARVMRQVIADEKEIITAQKNRLEAALKAAREGGAEATIPPQVAEKITEDASALTELIKDWRSADRRASAAGNAANRTVLSAEDESLAAALRAEKAGIRGEALDQLRTIEDYVQALGLSDKRGRALINEITGGGPLNRKKVRAWVEAKSMAAPRGKTPYVAKIGDDEVRALEDEIRNLDRAVKKLGAGSTAPVGPTTTGKAAAPFRQMREEVRAGSDAFANVKQRPVRADWRDAPSKATKYLEPKLQRKVDNLLREQDRVEAGIQSAAERTMQGTADTQDALARLKELSASRGRVQADAEATRQGAISQYRALDEAGGQVQAGVNEATGIAAQAKQVEDIVKPVADRIKGSEGRSAKVAEWKPIKSNGRTVSMEIADAQKDLQALVEASAKGAGGPEMDVAAQLLSDYANRASAIDGLAMRGQGLRELAADMRKPEFAMRTMDVIEKGWTEVAQGLTEKGIAVPDEVAQMLNRLTRFKDPSEWGKVTKVIDMYTNFFKTYATMTPGFHIRNAMSATFMNLADGVDLPNMTKGLGIWKRYARNPSGWLDEITDPVERELAEKTMKAVFASGGGQYDELAIAGHSRVVNNAATRLSRRAGRKVEGSVRASMAYDTLKKGGSLDEAIARVERIHFNYSDVSSLDEKMRRLVPFWTFLSRNVPLQIQEMWLKPRWYAMYNNVARNMRLDDENYGKLPIAWREVGAVPIGGQNYLAPDLPFTRLDQDLSMLSDPQRFLSNVNPLLKVPLETMVAKRKFYNDQPFLNNKFEKVDGELALLAPLLSTLGLTETAGNGQQVIDEKLGYALRNFIPLLAQGQRLAPTDEYYQQRQLQSIASYLGVPLRQATPATLEAERKRVQRQQSAQQSRQEALASFGR